MRERRGRHGCGYGKRKGGSVPQCAWKGGKRLGGFAAWVAQRLAMPEATVPDGVAGDFEKCALSRRALSGL
eukprot:359009-Chlamydomonas_euryale.AAC.10